MLRHAMLCYDIFLPSNNNEDLEKTCLIKKGVLKNNTKLTGKHLRQSRHRCFPMNFV